METCGRYDIHVYLGQTFRHQVTWKADGEPVDMTGCSAVLSAVDTAGDELFTLDTDAGISISGGALTLEMSGTSTAAVPATFGTYWLIVRFTGGDSIRLLEGNVIPHAGPPA